MEETKMSELFIVFAALGSIGALLFAVCMAKRALSETVSPSSEIV